MFVQIDIRNDGLFLTAVQDVNEKAFPSSPFKRNFLESSLVPYG